MKKKTRNLIGSIMVWSGLGALAITNLNMQLALKGQAILALTSCTSVYINWVAIALLLVGGLWGMRK